SKFMKLIDLAVDIVPVLSVPRKGPPPSVISGLMEQNLTSPSKEQRGNKTEETKTQPNNDYNEQVQEDPVDLCLGSSEMKQTTDPRFERNPEIAISTPLSPYKHTEKNVVEAEDAELPHQDTFAIQDSLEVFELMPDAQPGPVNSSELIHLLSFASLPYEIEEDIQLVDEISVISRHASPFQDLTRASMWPNETDLTASTPELAPAFFLPFSEACENVKTDMMVPTECMLKPDELMFLQTPYKPIEPPYQNNIELMQTSYPISEYPVCPQLLSKLTECPSEGAVGISGTVELACSLSFPRSETTQEAAMSPITDNMTQSQLGVSELLHHTDMLSASVPELLLNSSQSPSLDMNWGSDSALSELQEIKLAKRCPQPQQQSSCLTQTQQPQTVQLPPSTGDKPLHLLQAPPVYDHLSTKAHTSAGQQPVVLSESNYIQPMQHNSTSGFPPIPHFDVNHMQSDHQLISYFQPSLQPNNCLPSPVMSDRIFNLSSVRYDKWPHLVSQLNCNSIPSASHLIPDCSPQFPCTVPHILLPHFEININSQVAHSNTGGMFGLSSAEQPLMVESKSNRKTLSPHQYENYRLWKRYCKIAKTVSNITPDLEALACFFIPVIHSFTIQHPGLPLPTAVKKAVLEWEKHSNFDRMGYYHMAHKFMEIEEEELRAEEDPGTSEELTPRKQIPNQTDTQSTKLKDYFQFESPYKMKGSGSRSQKAKGGSGVPHGGKAVKGKVQNLAEEAFREYCEIMKGLESRIKEGSEVMKEQEVVDEDVEEGSFIEYLNKLCSQKEFVTEVAAEIDMAYISSLLSSDSNITDVLSQPETL
ncbi:hypothetical protein P4O66_012615, partial [Electrophorus voltai]